jgi:periplasmic protein TonB
MTKIPLRIRFKQSYKKILEISMLFALMLMIVMFQAFKRFDQKSSIIQEKEIVINVDEIPLTEQIKRPPPPARPSVPIPTEDEDVPEDLTIDETEIDFNEEPPPAPPPPKEAEETPFFVPYDSRPEIIGGMAEVKKYLKYPEIARRAGVAGTVFVQVLVDIQGNVIDTKVIKSLGNNGCDEAAIIALKKVKWKPALQRDKPVQVWIGIPVVFQLKDK